MNDPAALAPGLTVAVLIVIGLFVWGRCTVRGWAWARDLEQHGDDE